MKKIQEDSLDDWDIDGKIAKDRASQSEDIKAFVKEFQESVWTVFSQAVSVSMEYAGLEYSKYGDKKTYRVYGDNSFGLNYKPGMYHRYEIVLGRYGYVMWNGQLYSSDGPSKYQPDAKHIKEVAEKIRQDIYQCVKDKWDVYDMTSEWNIPFEDCFKIDSIGKGELTANTSEALYQAGKSKNPSTYIGLTAYASKKQGRKENMTSQEEKDWNGYKKLMLMKRILHIKFGKEHPDLQLKLLQTGDEEIVEGNYWNDTYWGVCEGVGENHLGKLLMEIREELKN